MMGANVSVDLVFRGRLGCSEYPAKLHLEHLGEIAVEANSGNDDSLPLRLPLRIVADAVLSQNQVEQAPEVAAAEDAVDDVRGYDLRLYDPVRLGGGSLLVTLGSVVHRCSSIGSVGPVDV